MRDRGDFGNLASEIGGDHESNERYYTVVRI